MKYSNPCMSISDLLSSIILILLLMFVLAAILPQYTQEAEKHEMMSRISAALQEYQNSGKVRIHLETGILEFTSVTFSSGSAELSPTALKAVKDFSDQLKAYMV